MDSPIMGLTNSDKERPHLFSANACIFAGREEASNIQSFSHNGTLTTWNNLGINKQETPLRDPVKRNQYEH